MNASFLSRMFFGRVSISRNSNAVCCHVCYMTVERKGKTSLTIFQLDTETNKTPTVSFKIESTKSPLEEASG